MNKDIENIFENYRCSINESPEAVAAAPAATGDPVADVEAAFANGPGQDAETLQAQVQALKVASDTITSQIDQLGLERDKVVSRARKGVPMPDDMNPATGEYRVTDQIQQLNQQLTQMSQLAATIQQPAAQMGVDLSPIMEAMERLFVTLKEHANWYVKCLIPENNGSSLHKRHQLKQMIFENNIPVLDEGDDDNYLRDVLGMEPEDFEHDDPDQAAMDRHDAHDAVELSRHDRPSSGPEDGLMGDVEALERLLDDETRAVMDDEGGTMSRREARETAKDIIKQMIDRL